MSKRKKKSPLVISGKTGEKFVQVKAVMSPLIPLLDGIPVTTFTGDKDIYIGLADAIKWVTGEMRHHSRERYEVILAVLKRFRDEVPAEDSP